VEKLIGEMKDGTLTETSDGRLPVQTSLSWPPRRETKRKQIASQTRKSGSTPNKVDWDEPVG